MINFVFINLHSKQIDSLSSFFLCISVDLIYHNCFVQIKTR